MAGTGPSRNARCIFLEAVEKHSPDTWDGYLDRACDGDAQLRRRVEALLQAHIARDSLLDDTRIDIDSLGVLLDRTDHADSHEL